jgi:hypothetical protein
VCDAVGVDLALNIVMQPTTHPPLEAQFNHSEPTEQFSPTSTLPNHFGIVKFPSDWTSKQAFVLQDANLPALRAKYRLSATLNHLVDDVNGGNLIVQHTSEEVHALL